MSNVTEVVTFADLYTDFIDRARESSSSASAVILAKRYINTGLRDMHVDPGNRFPWAERRGTLITHAPYTTGTVSITAAARTTVTGSSTLWNTAVTGFGFNNARVGGKMIFSGLSEIFEVETVTNDTTITLKSLYPGDALSGVSYTYFEDEYALASDFLRFVDINMFSSDLNIPLIGAQEFRRYFGRNDVHGKPQIAAHLQLNFLSTTAPRHRVVFHPYPADEYSIPYWYVTSNLAVTSAGAEQASLSADTDEPIVPRQYRHAIVFHALYHYYRDFKDDARSQEVKAEYTDLITRMCGETKVGDSRPRFVPLNRGRMVMRQRYSIDDRFDTVRDR